MSWSWSWSWSWSRRGPERQGEEGVPAPSPRVSGERAGVRGGSPASPTPLPGLVPTPALHPRVRRRPCSAPRRLTLGRNAHHRPLRAAAESCSTPLPRNATPGSLHWISIWSAALLLLAASECPAGGRSSVKTRHSGGEFSAKCRAVRPRKVPISKIADGLSALVMRHRNASSSIGVLMPSPHCGSIAMRRPLVMPNSSKIDCELQRSRRTAPIYCRNIRPGNVRTCEGRFSASFSVKKLAVSSRPNAMRTGFDLTSSISSAL